MTFITIFGGLLVFIGLAYFIVRPKG